MKKYQQFIDTLDKKLANYFLSQKEYIYCKKGCSNCCRKGDYPLSEIEMKYLMQGFLNLSNENKIKVQQNIKQMIKGEACPFLINDECSVYKYRPIICRVHGLAYFYKDKIVKVPYCANNGKNYSNVYKNGEISCEPINDNLETIYILKDFDHGIIQNLYDWIKPEKD